MNGEPSPQLIAVSIVMLAIVVVMGLVALRAAASTDFDLQRIMNLERNNKNLPSRYKKFKRIQVVVLALGTACLIATLWSVTVFYAAAQPGEDPDTMSVAIPAAFFGLPGVCICAYQAVRLGVKRRAITQLMADQRT